MSFLVKRTFNNGYRCCCHSTWEADDEWFPTEAEALAKLPTHAATPGEMDMEHVEVVSGATGETIAEGELEWTASERGQGYSHYRWHGHVRGERFESIVGNEPGESWPQMVSRLSSAALNKRLAEAEKKVDAIRAAASTAVRTSEKSIDADVTGDGTEKP